MHLRFTNISIVAVMLLSACGGRFGGAGPTGGTAGTGGSVGGAGGAGGSLGGTGGAVNSCSSPSDCMLESVGCCGGGCEPVDLSAYTAINRAYSTQYAQGCLSIPCRVPPCASVPLDQRNVPYFAATCESHTCRAVDVRSLGASDCVTSADCYLRIGTGCCESCSGGADQIVALSTKANPWLVLCGSEPVACPACAPVKPSGLTAVCSAGKCVVAQVNGWIDAGGCGVASGTACRTAQHVLHCEGLSGGAVCLTDALTCEGVSIPCVNQCTEREYGAWCGSIGGPSAEPPPGCRNVGIMPAGIAEYCCPCGP